jgi:hypothetical protein
LTPRKNRVPMNSLKIMKEGSEDAKKRPNR